MKLQALFSSKNKSKKIFKCGLLQFLFGALRVNMILSEKNLRWSKSLITGGRGCKTTKQQQQVVENFTKLAYINVVKLKVGSCGFKCIIILLVYFLNCR